jgi:beta-N-acetylhexosaminidase
MLDGVDVLLIDLQEVGVRCFTYISTMILALEKAAKNNVEVIVLDRPNPLSFWGAQGPKLDESCESFLGKINVPFMHGQTMGSLAKLANEKYQARLTVLSCSGDETSYFETNFKKPSPNITSLTTIYTYPMTVFVEGTNYSEGRGTYNPFQQIGAPWVDANELAQTLNNKKLSGVHFEAIEFTPVAIKGMDENPKHKGKKCAGVFLHILDREQIKPLAVGRALISTLFDLYPEESKFIPSGKKRYTLDLLVGNDTWRKEIRPEE